MIRICSNASCFLSDHLKVDFFGSISRYINHFPWIHHGVGISLNMFVPNYRHIPQKIYGKFLGFFLWGLFLVGLVVALAGPCRCGFLGPQNMQTFEVFFRFLYDYGLVK